MQTKDSAQIILDGIALLDQQKREISDIVQLFRGTLRAVGGFDRTTDWNIIIDSRVSNYHWELCWRSATQEFCVYCYREYEGGRRFDPLLVATKDTEHLPRAKDVAAVHKILHVFIDGMFGFSPKLRAELQPYIDAGS